MRRACRAAAGYFCTAAGVVIDLLHEEQPAVVDELTEFPGARLQQFDDALAARRARCRPKLSRHRPASRSSGVRRDDQLAGRQPHDVLLVEPVELLGIEDGVAAADALEREALDELRSS